MLEHGIILGLLLVAGACQIHIVTDLALDELLLFEGFVLVIILLIVWLHQNELARGKRRINLTHRQPFNQYHERARLYTEHQTAELVKSPDYNAWLHRNRLKKSGHSLSSLELEECSSESDYEELTLHEVATTKKLF